MEAASHPAPIAARAPRVEPGVWPVAIVVIGYAILVPGLMKLLGPDYDQIFRTAENTWKGAVIPLAVGVIYLLIVLSVLRWDDVFRDPARLRMTKLLWAPPVLMVIGLIVRLTGVEWGAATFQRVIAIITAGILVGFCEETVFRGILLRGLRTGMRPEAKVALYSSLTFGVFHFTNLLSSSFGGTFVQVVIASVSGFSLYLARRGTGLLIAGMALHGLWDMSTFFSEMTAKNSNVGTYAALGLMVFTLIVALVAAAVNWKKDSWIAVTPYGIEELGSPGS